MTECVITSSALIAAVIILRAVFRRKISRRLQYALWGLVLLRLLIPFSLLKSPISIMNIVDLTPEPRQAVQTATQKNTVNYGGLGTANQIDLDQTKASSPAISSSDYKAAKTNNSWPMLKIIWLSGSAAALIWFAFTNLIFYLKLRKTRIVYSAEGTPLPTYVCGEIASPCLYGIVRPAVYLTPKALESEERINYVLAHELCHYRHGDNIWSLLRGLCLAVYWWNPLVWIAAVLSRTDSEMSCDESVLKQIGEAKRFEYGRALIDMIAVKKAPIGLMCSATTMISGKRGVKSRLDMIVKNPKTLIPALAAVILASVLCVGCTFTGAKSVPLSSEEALGKLISSVSPTDGQVSFTIPTGYPDPKNWNIHISGRMVSGDFSQSLHFYDDINEARTWEPGKTYTIALSKDYTELSMLASLPDGKGGTIEKSANLLPSISYTVRRMGAAGNVLFLSGDGAKLAEDLINDFMVRSAAWPAVDIKTLDECFYLQASYPNGSKKDYYAYKLDGISYVQFGTYRTRVNTELYEKFKALALSGLTARDKAEERFALDYIDKVIRDFKSYGVVITDSKITNLKRVARFENMAEFPIELWLLEYRLKPEDMSKVIFAGGMNEENGYITEYASMGQPYLIISYQNGKPSYMGNIWTGNIGEEGGMENALRLWLENSRLIKPETYSGSHYTVSFKLSDGSEAKLVLSQPVRKDASGIWCAERWYDSRGGLYLVSPETKGLAADYYADLQKECDSGHRPGLLDPKQVALEYITGRLGQLASLDSVKLSGKYTGVDTNVVIWNLLNIICSSPAEASNPWAYINAHKDEYKILADGGEVTLRYVYSEFLKGGQTGLNGHIMLALMREILGAEAPDLGTYSTGQDWFDKWKQWASKNRTDIESSKPKTAILFEIMGR